MKYEKTIRLKDGRACLLKSAGREDAAAVLEVFVLTHAQTDFLLSGPEESPMPEDQEALYLQAKKDSPDEIEILALVDGHPAGLAGIGRIGSRLKVRHRADLGISIDREFWGLGIGRALLEACLELAREAGYAQVELDVVSDNDRAIDLYQKAGFVEYGRNPRGFLSPVSGWQELVLMRLELEGQTLKERQK